MRFTKFSKIVTLADLNGQVKNYKSFYEKESKDSLAKLETEKNKLMQDVWRMNFLIAKAENQWFENHNPCFNVTDKVIQKLKSLNMSLDIDFNYMPFSTYAVCFPKDMYRYKDNEDKEQTTVNGLIISRAFNFLDIIFYVSTKDKEFMFLVTFDLDNTDYLSQIKKYCKNTQNLIEMIDIALQIGFLSSNKLQAKEDEKTLVSVQSKKNKNISIVSDINYDNYIRYLEPIWKNINSNLKNLSDKQYHYQFTRKAHWRKIREKGTNRVKKTVWVRNSIIRKDLPKKIELLSF